MSITASHQLDEAVAASRQHLLASLEESFAAEFAVAARDPDGQWRRLSSGPLTVDTAYDFEPEALDACDDAISTRGPQAIVLSSERVLLAIPVTGEQPSPQVAYGQVTGADPDFLLRTARLWIAAASTRQQVDRYRIENEFFAEQLSDGLEELTFLRSVVEHLDVSDTSNDLMTLAQTTLPLLNETIKAEGMALLLVDDSQEPLQATPVFTAGPRGVSDWQATLLVRSFGAAALSQPVVKNRLVGSPEGANIEGVREFVLVPLAARNQLMGWLLAVNRYWPDDNRPLSEWPLSQLEFGTSEASLLATTASILATHASNLELFREKVQMLIGVVRSLVMAVESKDEYTCGHSERVALFGRLLAEHLGYDQQACERLYLTGLLHDVGKIGVSDAVLKKPGPLTDEEFDEIKRHPDEGWAILHDLEQLGYVLPGVLYHHEQYNGRGYPDQLAGEEIPLDGRILAIVDAYDAMTSDRPYRAGMPAERAQEILRSGAGTQWDARLVDAFFEALDRIESVRRNYQLRERPTRREKCLTPCSLPNRPS